MKNHNNKKKNWSKNGRSNHDRKPYSKGRNDNYKRTDGGGNKNFVEKHNLSETQVGITEFLSNSAGFTGILKSRYSDFHVNEIDRDGKVLHLTDLKIPQAPDTSLSAEEIESARAQLNGIITPELWTQIMTLAVAVKGEPIIFEVTKMNKDERTLVHKLIKSLFAGKLVSSTTNVAPTALKTAEEETVDKTEERKFIQIMKPKGPRDQNRNAWGFPAEYVHFLVHKENLTTSEVATAIADRIRINPSLVNYCGTKDKRANTTQTFCIKKRTPSQIVRAVEHLRNVHVGNFEFKNESLKLGDLNGNRFRIALRHLSGDQTEIDLALHHLRDRGFINYYGLQRFGNSATVPTYEVGVALLNSDYKLACELILKPRDNELPFLQKIRECWWKERNAEKALEMFRPNNKCVEKLLLQGLLRCGENDYATSLRKIPRNTLMLYTHAFQSLVFNKMASRRIKEFGQKLIPGDLVYCNKNEIDAVITEPTLIEDIEENVPEIPSAADTENETDDAENAENEAEDSTKSKFKNLVKPLTAEDIASGNYTLFDVVLPLPGYDITYPDNVVATWYEEFLGEHGLSSQKLRHNIKTFSLPGAYRRLLMEPTQFSWEFRNYETAETTLIASDWNECKKKQQTSDANTTEGNFRALILDFCLSSSAYATMLVRELLKADTSAAHQIKLQKMQQVEKPSADNAEEAVNIKKSEASASSKAGEEVLENENESDENQKSVTEENNLKRKSSEDNSNVEEAKKEKLEI